MEETTENNTKLLGGVTGKGFVNGDPRINREGRKPMTPEDRLIKKAQKDFIKEYKEKLTEALPTISPILISMALDGDIQAIKEVNDRALGKATQTIEHRGGVELTLLSMEQKAILDGILNK